MSDKEVKKENAVIYLSTYESIEKYFKNKAECWDVMRALLRYEYFDEEIPEKILKNIKFEILWDSIKPIIDKRLVKYRNGKRGGRPTKTAISEESENQAETEPKPNENQTKTKRKPKRNQAETKPKPYVYEDVNASAYEDADAINNTSRREIPGGDSLAPQDGYEDGYFKPADEVWEEYKAQQKGEKQKCTNITKMTPSDSQDT